MGTVTSIDSCSAGTGEAKKDSLFMTPSEEDLAKYNDLQHTLIHNHQSPITHTPDPNTSAERSIGVTLKERRGRVITRSGVLSGSYNDDRSSSKSSTPSSDHRSTSSFRNISKVASSHRPTLKGVRRVSSKVLGKVSFAATVVGHSSKRLLFSHQQNGHSSSSPSPKQRIKHRGKPPPTLHVSSKVRGGVLLRGCCTDDEHIQMVRDVIEAIRPLHGAEGLAACGFEFRLVSLNGDVPAVGRADHNGVPDLIEEPRDGNGRERHNNHNNGGTPVAGDDLHCDCDDDLKERSDKEVCDSDCKDAGWKMTRLFHYESDTMITEKNRKEFIADGDMYDAVARVAMEYAQEVMIREGQMDWVTIAEAGNNAEPIRALVSSRIVEDEARLDTEPTLLIATGKGKVRAGIFSRQHLLLSGMECSTAVPIVREARKRKMNVVMVDPNVHGDRFGMVTFEKSMAHLFRRWEGSDDSLTNLNQPPLTQRDLYVLSHSQSGAQFARYLLDKADFYVPHIRAVAFTDSNHNVQWAKDKEELRHLLESDSCVYFKCANDSNKDTLSPLPSVGEVVDTDKFWNHRFGKIKTVCAGTSEHSLTNWFARSYIWDHFDRYLGRPVSIASKEIRHGTPLSDRVDSPGLVEDQ